MAEPIKPELPPDFQIQQQQEQKEISADAAPPVKGEDELIDKRATDILIKDLYKSAGFFSGGTIGEKRISKVLSDIKKDKSELTKLEKQRAAIEKTFAKTMKTGKGKKIEELKEKHQAITRKIAEQRGKLLENIASQQKLLGKLQEKLPRYVDIATTLKSTRDKKYIAALNRTEQLVNKGIVLLERARTEVSTEEQQKQHIEAVVKAPQEHGHFEVRSIFDSLVKRQSEKPEDKRAEGHLRLLALSLGMEVKEGQEIKEIIPMLNDAIGKIRVTVAEVVDRIKLLGPRAISGDREALAELLLIQNRLETMPSESPEVSEVMRQVGPILDGIWDKAHIAATGSSFIDLTMSGKIPTNERLMPRYRAIFENMDFGSLRQETVQKFFRQLPGDFREQLSSEPKLREIPRAPFQMPSVDKYRSGAVPDSTINDTRRDVQTLCRQVALGSTTPTDAITLLRDLRGNSPQLMMAIAGDRASRDMIQGVIDTELDRIKGEGPLNEMSALDKATALELQFDLHLDHALYATQDPRAGIFSYDQLVSDLQELAEMGNAQVTASAIQRLLQTIDQGHLTPSIAVLRSTLEGTLQNYKKDLPLSVSEETLTWMRATGPRLRTIQNQLKTQTANTEEFTAISEELSERIAAARKSNARSDLEALQKWQSDLQSLAKQISRPR